MADHKSVINPSLFEVACDAPGDRQQEDLPIDQDQSKIQHSKMSARMAREIKLLTTEPPPGVCAWPANDRLDELSAQLQVHTSAVDSKSDETQMFPWHHHIHGSCRLPSVVCLA